MSPMLYFVFMLAQSIDAHIVDSRHTEGFSLSVARDAVSVRPQAAESVLQSIFGRIAVAENTCSDSRESHSESHKSRCQ